MNKLTTKQIIWDSKNLPCNIDEFEWVSANDAEEVLEALMDCFVQGTGGEEADKYDHMCLSAYENAQDLLIRLGKLKPEHCSRK